jgi:hypothetical protein
MKLPTELFKELVYNILGRLIENKLSKLIQVHEA